MPGGHGSKKQIGAGSQGKGSSAGGMTDTPEGMLGENMVLSNRDKSQHSSGRGADGKAIQAEQLQDTSANRERDD